MKNKILYTIFIALANCVPSFSQSSYVPINRDYYHLIDRYEIMNGAFPEGIHSSVKPYTRKAVAEFSENLFENPYLKLSDVDKFNLTYLIIDNWEWSNHGMHLSKKPIFRNFYQTKNDFYNVNAEGFDLHISPALHFEYGWESAGPHSPYINTRGAEMRGTINKKVGFYSYVGENQARYMQHGMEYVEDRGVVPGEGFWKSFKDNALDFIEARGYITFEATKNIHVMFGQDRNFIGNGYRSLILSDFSNNYLFLKLNTKIWRFNYTNLFTQLYADHASGRTGSHLGPYPTKYLALHHLSLNLFKNLNIGIFEGIVSGKFTYSYLNPIIFYRYLEHQSGSEDNFIAGTDFKWNLFKRFSLYGQFVLDEFVLSNLRAQNGWWANKYAGQIGLKQIDAMGVKNLDLQFEANFARPFMYTHMDEYTNYAHYRMPLAHPLGANFKEMVGIVRYQPLPWLNLQARFIGANYGEDSEENNYGGDIMKDYKSRTYNFGNEIGQGVASRLIMADYTASFHIKHNIFVDLKHVRRQVTSELPERDRNNQYTGLALRMNIARVNHSF